MTDDAMQRIPPLLGLTSGWTIGLALSLQVHDPATLNNPIFHRVPGRALVERLAWAAAHEIGAKSVSPRDAGSRP